MKNSKITDNKLLKIFKLLDKEETRRFKKLLQSSFFTTNAHLLRLYDYLIKYYPYFDSPKLTKALIFTYLFPDRAYNDNKLRMLLRKFTRQLEDFLVIKEVQGNEEERKKYLVGIYGKRNEMKLFEKETFKILEKLKNAPIKDKNKLYDQQKLIQQYIYHPTASKLSSVNSLQNEMIENLELFYLTNKIWLDCNMLSSQNFLKSNYSFEKTEELIGNLPKEYLQLHSSLNIYIDAFNLLKTPSNNNYFLLKINYQKKIKTLNISDRRDLLVYLLNYAIFQYNKGELIFLNESFGLFKLGLNQALFVENSRFDENTFSNCCIVAARLGEFGWANNFINTYAQYLDEKYSKDIKTLSQAYLLFYQNNYKDLIEAISSYQFARLIDIQRAKSLLLRSYFDLFLSDNSYYSLFVSYANAYEKFLRRDAFTLETKIVLYLNLIKNLRKIAKLIQNKNWNTKWKNKFKQKIIAENLILKQWLIEKLNQL